jgi:hypothetical protein
LIASRQATNCQASHELRGAMLDDGLICGTGVLSAEPTWLSATLDGLHALAADIIRQAVDVLGERYKRLCSSGSPVVMAMLSPR